MSPLEILKATLQGQPCPRIPICCNLLDQGARELGMSQAEYYSSGENVANAQLQMRSHYGYDNVWSLFYVGREAELLGCREIFYDENGSPNVADFVIKNYDDIEKLEVPADITSHQVWEETAKCLKILRSEVGGTHPICAYITASNSLPSMLMGMENWMELFLTGPFDLRDELLRKCNNFVQKHIAAYRAGGADLLFYASPFGSTSFVDLKRFQTVSLPWIKRDLAAGVEDVVYFSAMAPFNNVIKQIQQELGIGAYYISPLADLAEAKAIIGQSALTCGIINDIKMVHWTPEQTRAEVKRLCEIGKPGQHFLFGTAIMPLQIPEANIQAMMKAAFEYGNY